VISINYECQVSSVMTGIWVFTKASRYRVVKSMLMLPVCFVNQENEVDSSTAIIEKVHCETTRSQVVWRTSAGTRERGVPNDQDVFHMPGAAGDGGDEKG
jgi:hypothetical protein